MATPFSDVYSSFTRKISDYTHINLSAEELENILFGFLISAVPKFKFCATDLSYNVDTKCFLETLSQEEIEILATLMICEWLNPYVNTTELLKQVLPDKDFKIYSQANHLKELMDLQHNIRDEAESLIISYTYTNGNLEDLT